MPEALGPGPGIVAALDAAPMIPTGTSLNFTTFEPHILAAANGDGVSAAANVAAAISTAISSAVSAISAAFGLSNG